MDCIISCFSVPVFLSNGVLGLALPHMTSPLEGRRFEGDISVLLFPLAHSMLGGTSSPNPANSLAPIPTADRITGAMAHGVIPFDE